MYLQLSSKYCHTHCGGDWDPPRQLTVAKPVAECQVSQHHGRVWDWAGGGGEERWGCWEGHRVSRWSPHAATLPVGTTG